VLEDRFKLQLVAHVLIDERFFMGRSFGAMTIP